MPEDLKPFCTCFPRDFTPAEPWHQGCSGEAKCKTTAYNRLPADERMRLYQAFALERSAAPVTAFDVAPRLSKLGVPGMALAAAKNPDETQAIEAAKRWVKADVRLLPALVLVGDKGTGKTVAATWATLQWAKSYPWNEMPSGPMVEPMVWLDSSGMRRLGDFGPEAARLVEQLATARWVVFDDTGREGSPRAMEAVSDALMERCDKSRRFVLTTNLTKDAFDARYGAPLSDRLRAHAVIARVTGGSMRRRSA